MVKDGAFLMLYWSKFYLYTTDAEAEAEAPLLWPPDMNSWLTGEDPDAGKDWRQEDKRVTEDEMVGWRHWFNEHELGQIPGDGEGQEGLACCSPWDCRVGCDLATKE